MILSVFTIIPMSASAAEGDTVSVYARKWIRAEVVTGDYFRVSDLYEGFKICRVNPNGGFDPTNLSTTQVAVWNQTGDMSLNDSNRNGGNKLTINSWDLTAAWGIDPGRQNDGYIYLSTHETDGVNYNDGAQRWFYTWEVFSGTERAAVSPTYDAATGEYQNGTATAYYTAGDRYFIADGKVFKVGEPLVVPAKTQLRTFDPLNPNYFTTWKNSKSDTDYIVEYSDDYNGSLKRHTRFLTRNVLNHQTFTGLYYTKYLVTITVITKSDRSITTWRPHRHGRIGIAATRPQPLH